MGLSFADAKMDGFSYSPKVGLNGSVLTVDPAPCRIGSDKYDMESVTVDFKKDAGKQFSLSVIKRAGSGPTFYLLTSDLQTRPQGTPEQVAGAERAFPLVSGIVSQDGNSVDGRVLRFGW